MRRGLRVLVGAILTFVLLYHVVGNVLLMSGALERIISRKPEKLKIEWSHAWTLLPGRIEVDGFKLDIRTRNHNQIHIGAVDADIRINLFDLIDRTVHFDYVDATGLTLSYVKLRPPERAKPEVRKPAAEAQGQESAGGARLSPSTPPDKPPWIVKLSNVTAADVRQVRFNWLNIEGHGNLHELAMRVVTKGGPLRIDRLALDMNARIDPGADLGRSDAGTVHLKTDFKMAENIPKNNKGLKLLKFVSGQARLEGDVRSIEFINPLFGGKYNLMVSGRGKLDLRAVLEAGELIDGSMIDFKSDHIGLDFLDLSAAGAGRISGRVDKKEEEPTSIKFSVTDFRLRHQDQSNPYMEGADLFVDLKAKRFYLDHHHESEVLVVDFAHSSIPDLTDFNRFIPKHANVEFLSGSGHLKGSMFLSDDAGHANLELTGKDVLIDVQGNQIGADLTLVTKLKDGKYEEKSYDLAGTRFRLDNVEIATTGERAHEGWWGEIEITRGNLIWTEPMDVDAQMTIRMRDTEPLVALLRGANKKKKSLLDRTLSVKDLNGTLELQTNEEDILLDPVLIKGKGLEVLSKLDIEEKTMNGSVYVKLRGISVRFVIEDNKARLKGVGGKKKVSR